MRVTLRQTTKAILLSGALALSGVAVLPVSQAAATTADAPARAIGSDPLADRADRAFATLGRFFFTGNQAAWARFDDERDAIAGELATRLGIEPARMQAAWAEADLVHQGALIAAVTQLGVPYRRNASKPGVGFDCSGLTTYAWSRVGITLARQSTTQIRNARSLTRETAQAGDLVQYPGHVMMYLGVDGAIIHSPYTGRTVEVDVLSDRRINNVRFGNPIG